MSLTGDVNTLALADLVQVSALNGRTCQIHVIAPHAEGDLFLDQGSVVHAWWGDLVGAEAVYAMLNTPDVGFHVRPDICPDAQTVAAGWQHLVLEAARRQDHGSVPRPTTRSSPRWGTDASEHVTTTLRRHAVDFAQPLSQVAPLPLPPPPRAAPPRLLLIFAVAALALSLAVIGTLVVRRAQLLRARTVAAAAAPMATTTPPPSDAVPLDASLLTGPGDVLPSLITGTPPSPPRSQWAMAPTIVCRIVVGANGVVQQSRIYRSRLELSAFEDAALAAVETYLFRPALHAGQPVPVVMNWPVRFGDAQSVRTLRIKGSDTIGGALAPALARAFTAAQPDVELAIEALGSKTAFVGLYDGSADLGASSRPVNADELKQAARLGLTLREFVFAYDGVAVIVHPDNPLRSLTLEELGRVFGGAVTDWSALGGPSGPIHLLNRPTYSGTRTFFRDKVLRHGDAKSSEDFAPSARVIEDNRELVATVADDVNAIGFVSHGWLGPTVRALGVASSADGPAVAPETATIRDGSYPIYRPLLFYTRGAPGRDLAQFLRYVLGAAGQAIVRDAGFVPIDVPAGEVIAASDLTTVGAPVEPLRISFEAGATRLSEAARGRLEALARSAEGAHLLVIGHSDSDGTTAGNHRLAEARAHRVADYLTAAGVDLAAVDVEVDDADAPLASNASAQGRRQNRRVDVFRLVN